MNDDVTVSRYTLMIALSVCESLLEETYYDDVALAVVEMKDVLGELDE